MTINRPVLAALALAAAAGCGGGISAPRTAPVTGTVTVKGKAVAGVTVKFHARFDMGAVTFTPSGTTDKDGKFTLTTAAPNDGAPPGEYAVTFELLRAGADKRGQDIDVDAWNGKYADPGKAEKVTVKAGENAVGPFALN